MIEWDYKKKGRLNDSEHIHLKWARIKGIIIFGRWYLHRGATILIRHVHLYDQTLELRYSSLHITKRISHTGFDNCNSVARKNSFDCARFWFNKFRLRNKRHNSNQRRAKSVVKWIRNFGWVYWWPFNVEMRTKLFINKSKRRQPPLICLTVKCY